MTPWPTTTSPQPALRGRLPLYQKATTCRFASHRIYARHVRLKKGEKRNLRGGTLICLMCRRLACSGARTRSGKDHVGSLPFGKAPRTNRTFVRQWALRRGDFQSLCDGGGGGGARPRRVHPLCCFVPVTGDRLTGSSANHPPGLISITDRVPGIRGNPARLVISSQ